METKTFGKTGKNVYVLGLGTYGHGEAYGGISKENSINVLKEVVKQIPDEAFFLIDTAPRYGCGKVEKWVGEFVRNSGRNNLLIATKGGRHIEPVRVNEKDFSSDFLRKDLDNSLKRLSVKRIFLYQLHNPNLQLLKNGNVFDLLESFRKESKIEWFGVSIDNPKEGIAAIKYCEKQGLNGLAAIQVIYNVLQKNGLDNLFQLAHKHNVAIIAREPLLRGFLTDQYSENTKFENCSEAVKKQIKLYGKNRILLKINELRKILSNHNIKCMIQLSIKFAISNPYVTLVIPGINRIEYIKNDLDSAELEINEIILKDIENIWDLKKC
jgi:myo-inositol catabolism protein IolS